MSSKIDIRPVVTDHVDTLVNQAPDGGPSTRSVADLVIQYALPTATGFAVALLGAPQVNSGSLLSGAAILTAFSFGLAIFAFQARTDDKSPKGSTRLRLLDEFFANVLYSVVVGLAWTLVLMVFPSDETSPIITRVGGGFSAGLGLHYLLVLLMCVKRLRAVYRDATR